MPDEDEILEAAEIDYEPAPDPEPRPEFDWGEV